MEEWKIVPMNQTYCEEMARWEYPGEYAFYNGHREIDFPAGEVFACVDASNHLVGRFSYGQDARIPTIEENVYGEDFLDIGLGMRPDLCGRGLGEGFVQLGLNFGRSEFGAEKFRLSVAGFNKRAQKVYKRCGFQIQQEVTNSYFKNKFYIMTLE